MDAATLLARCREGDDLAWELFVRQYQGRVYAIAGHYATGADEGRDFAQEVFVRLYEKRHAWAPADRFLAWLICFTRNACIDLVRRRRTRVPAADLPADELELAGDGRNPEQESIARSTGRLVRRALRRLGGMSREIIVLREIQGLSLAEIGSLLNVPTGTVKSRANRARVELARKVLELDRASARGSSGGDV
jgi:RNA polymerase sigma-70 factor (ECF subfamily)